MKHIVILGASGTLGLPMTRYFKEKGYLVTAVGHKNGTKDFFDCLGVDYQTIDIADEETFYNLPQDGVDCVIDFAGCLPAMMGVNDSNTLYSDTIVRGTINVLNYMRRIDCHKLIFPQSVYDLHHLFGTPEPIAAEASRENPVVGDHSIYVICKNAAVDIIEYYHNEYGIDGIVLRLPGVYQYHPKPYILINGKMRVKSERIVIEKAKRGEPIEIWGDPHRVLESICVEDFLQIVDLAVSTDDVHGIFNVGNGGSTLEERILGIRDVFCHSGNVSEIRYCPDKKDCTQYVLDIEKTKRVLGYEPQYSWKDYLELLKWHMENQPNKEVWGTFEQYYYLLR